MTPDKYIERQVTVVQLHVDDKGETHYQESLYDMTETGLMAHPDISSGTRAFYLDLPAENLPLLERQFMVVISGSVLSDYNDSDICHLYPDNIIPVKAYSHEAFKHAGKGDDAIAFIVRF